MSSGLPGPNLWASTTMNVSVIYDFICDVFQFVVQVKNRSKKQQRLEQLMNLMIRMRSIMV